MSNYGFPYDKKPEPKLKWQKEIAERIKGFSNFELFLSLYDCNLDDLSDNRDFWEGEYLYYEALERLLSIEWVSLEDIKKNFKGVYGRELKF